MKTILISLLLFCTTIFASEQKDIKMSISVIKERTEIQKTFVTEDKIGNFETKFTESFTYVAVEDGKPKINTEPMGIKVKLSKDGEKNFLTVFIKTEKGIVFSSSQTEINSFQRMFLIEAFQTQSEVFEYEVLTTKEDLILEIGEDYKIKIKFF